MNYKLIATQFGESIKYETTINEVNRIFMALTDEVYKEYPNESITSARSFMVYNWVNTIADSNLEEKEKISIIKQAIEALVSKERVKLKLLSLLPRKQSAIKIRGYHYVNPERIKELKNIKSKKFDLTKLIKLCEELNFAFGNKSYLSVAMIVRAILDHVPPIFGCKKFSGVANNYKGSKSFKESMTHLDGSSRKIADAFLHVQIRQKETLPNSTQVDFSNDADVLFSEIVRLLR